MINRLPLAALALLLVATPPEQAHASDTATLKAEVQETIETFKRADSGLASFFAGAVGYVVFPSVGKGGFVLGGAHGTGLAYEKGRLIGRAKVTQVTLGAQVGGQSFSEVIFFETQAALDHFKESKLTMSAQVGAVAAAEGVSRNARYVDGVLVFTKVRSGLMAEASIGGQKLKFERLDE